MNTFSETINESHKLKQAIGLECSYAIVVTLKLRGVVMHKLYRTGAREAVDSWHDQCTGLREHIHPILTQTYRLIHDIIVTKI